MVSFESSPMESARFGVNAWRAMGSGAELGGVRRMARERGAELVIVRCDAADAAGVHALEENGARLMDSHLSYERTVDPLPPQRAPDALHVRTAVDADASDVALLAAEAFAEYGGHFHADPRLAARAPEVYEDWARRAVLDATVADVVLVAESEDGTIAGFSCLQVQGRLGVGFLDAVAARMRGRGIYMTLGEARIREAHTRGAGRIVVRTHLTNLGARRGLIRLGFLPASQEYTFHLWMTDQP